MQPDGYRLIGRSGQMLFRSNHRQTAEERRRVRADPDNVPIVRHLTGITHLGITSDQQRPQYIVDQADHHRTEDRQVPAP